MVVCSGSCMHCKEQTAFGHSTLFWCGPLQLLLATDFAQTQGADAKAYRHSYGMMYPCTTVHLVTILKVAHTMRKTPCQIHNCVTTCLRHKVASDDEESGVICREGENKLERIST
eukprot:1146307-Pelagomonas_calceolata.AAC.3